jgi:hypothetical protein
MWTPQPGNQEAAYFAGPDVADEIFYGGERGGGKSDLQLGKQEKAALSYEGKSRGILFRKTYAELEELQGRAMEVFPAEGAVYKTNSSAEYPFTNCWYWPNGATCKMRYIEHERDYGRYHGHQYTHIGFDEVTEYATPAGIVKMLSTLRSPHGVPCQVVETGNPGGVGHGWVKSRHIDIGQPMTRFRDPDTGFVRMYIPSKTADNKILLINDPRYTDRIRAATGGNEALRKAWLEGDWNIVAGAFFDCWSNSRHVIRPFDIPPDWTRFRSGDWGSARPFSFGWWAIVGDDWRTDEGLILPRGCLVRYREWYGMKRDASGQPVFNAGIKMPAEAVGAELWQREYTDPKLTYGVLDPAAYAEDGGPSIYERIYRGSGKNIKFRKADNARVPKAGALGGWDQLRSRLIGEGEDRPMIVCFNTCVDSIRTIPVLQHDADRLEDVDTDQEDHAADEWRYACMSRPYSRKVREIPDIETQLKNNSIASVSMGKLTQQHLKQMRKRRENF